MFKKIMAMIVVGFAMGVGVQAELPDPLPKEIEVTQRWFSWTTTFDIETKQFKLGYVHRKILSWTTTYDFYSYNDQLEARAKARWFTWGATFDVTDAADKPIGLVHQKVLTWFPTYEIVSPEGEKLAEAKLNFWGTTLTLKDSSDQVIATVHRPFFAFKSNWKMTLENPELLKEKKIDPRLIINVLIFQTDREAQARRNSNNNNNTRDIAHSAMKRSGEAKPAVEESMESIREEIEPYREELSQVEPTEQDFASVDKVAEETLSQASDEEAEITSEQDRLVLGFKKLIPMLSSDELTPGQKSALFLLMNKE